MMVRNSLSWLVLGVSLLACGLLGEGATASAPPEKPKPDQAGYKAKLRPFVDRYCAICHTLSNPPAGITFDDLTSVEGIIAHPDTWDRIARAIESHHMPPMGHEAPTDAQRKEIVAWIRKTLRENCDPTDPGRVTMRRLNKAEYDNTIRDLIGQDLRLAEGFPSDDVGYGFDNIGDVLSSSPLLLEKVLQAAEKAAQAAIPVPESVQLAGDGGSFDGGQSANVNDEGMVLFSRTTAWIQPEIKNPGSYQFTAYLYGHQAGPDVVQSALLVNGQLLHQLAFPAKRGKPMELSVPLTLGVGKHKIEIAFLNDFWDPNAQPADRNLVITGYTLEGPQDPAPVQTPFMDRWNIAIPANRSDWRSRARESISKWAPRVYRRPLKSGEADRLLALAEVMWKRGEPYLKGLQVSLQGALSAPQFMFRVEADSAGPRDLTAHELASRLSYFLWSSCPDDELVALADSGQLLKPEVLQTQAMRLLKDPKSRSLATEFASQWLQLRRMEGFQPNAKQFPTFDAKTRKAAVRETELFFERMVREDLPLIEMLTSKITHVNGPLARHYGIQGIEGDEFRRVEMADPRRTGILTQASILSITSNPNRTSPTKRGKWVLEVLLGTPPPPAPPGAGTLSESKKVIQGKTLRERMDEHRKDPTCASCHLSMDPIGFGLENFDPVGRWREMEADRPVDARGDLPGGVSFTGPVELRDVLLTKKPEITRNFVIQMFTFALGRGPTRNDECNFDTMAESVQKAEYRFSEVIRQVVSTDAFRRRAGSQQP